jgi:hypothetical protein
MYLPIFVMNHIPSEVFRARNPSLKIRKNKKTGFRYIEPNVDFSVNQALKEEISSPLPETNPAM